MVHCRLFNQLKAKSQGFPAASPRSLSDKRMKQLLETTENHRDVHLTHFQMRGRRFYCPHFFLSGQIPSDEHKLNRLFLHRSANILPHSILFLLSLESITGISGQGAGTHPPRGGPQLYRQAYTSIYVIENVHFSVIFRIVNNPN